MNSPHVGASGLPITQLGSTIKSHMGIAEKYEGKAEEHYKSAGIHLMEAKARIATGEYEGRFCKFLMQECNALSPSRAYELISIANGTKTVADIRAAVNERAARRKANSPMASDGPEAQPNQPLSENNPGNSQPKRGRPAAPKSQGDILAAQVTKACKSMTVPQLQTLLQFARTL